MEVAQLPRGSKIFQWLVVERHLGWIELVFLSHYGNEQPCQNGIPAAGRHDIIYLFSTVLPPIFPLPLLLQTACTRVKSEGQDVSAASSQPAPSPG